MRFVFAFGCRVVSDRASDRLLDRSNRADFLRFLLASVLLGAFLVWRGPFRRADFRFLWRCLNIGGSFSFYFIFMFEALETATPVSTLSIFTLMPFIAICLDRAFFAKLVGWPLLLSLLLGAWCALIVVFKGELSNLLTLSLERGETLSFSAQRRMHFMQCRCQSGAIENRSRCSVLA